MGFNSLPQNVEARDVIHAQAAGVEGGKDVSTINRTWKSYFWDSWDKSHDVRHYLPKPMSQLSD